MSKLFIQIMDTKIILAAGSLKGEEYTFEFQKEIDIEIFKETSQTLKELVVNEFIQGNVLTRGSKRREINIIYSAKGILYRIVKIPIMPIDDLEKMMELEKEEYLSVNSEEYEIRYKIVEKYDENGQLFWDIALAGVEKNNLNILVDALDQAGFKINYVEILPANYQRLFSKIEEKDIIIIEDDGDFSRICILKNGQVFLYADFPIDNGEMFLSEDYSKLVSEVRGYMDYYSSRNFGKNIDALLLLRNYNRESIRLEFMDTIQIKIYSSQELQDILLKKEEKGPQEDFIERYYAPISLMNL